MQHLVLFFLLLLPLFGNGLENAASPYLRQHKDNPVEWYSWSEQAFELAKKKNKPIFLSIGYSTCHWCHVMERESFSDKEVAELLNRYFIAIKVDKEELPFVDAYFQQLFKEVKHRYGGWPLSIFMTPDKQVFYMAGYIPKYKKYAQEGFMHLLPRLYALYLDEKQLQKQIEMIQSTVIPSSKASKPKLMELKKVFLAQYDDIYGGFGMQAKFPQPQKLQLLLDVALTLHDKALEEAFFMTLDAMATKGIYDSVDGGWFRYSVDASWEIPHFEKMLYTQAEMIELYARAYKIRKKPLYKKVIKETVSMLDHRFRSQEGLYYSASDAESAGQEGNYYTFTPKELQDVLHGLKDADMLKEALDDLPPNFNDRIHISLEEPTRPQGFEILRQRLQSVRKKRTFPFIDKKINLAWNAMLARALYQASFIDSTYQKKADRIMTALQKKLFDKGRLYHYMIDGRRIEQNELLEDYSFFVAALLAKYEKEMDAESLHFAKYLLLHTRDIFYKKGFFVLDNSGFGVQAPLDDKYYTSAYGAYLLGLVQYCHGSGEKKMCSFAKDLLEQLSLDIDTPAATRAFLMLN